MTQQQTTVQLKYKKAAQRVLQSEQALDKLGMELQQARTEVIIIVMPCSLILHKLTSDHSFLIHFCQLQAKEVSLAEIKATSEVLQHANVQMQGQMGSASRDLESRINDLQRQLEEEQRRAVTAAKLAEDATKESAATQSMVQV